MGRRSFAGYNYGEKLHAGFYGDLYRASTAGGNQAVLLEIDPDLAAVAGFSETLTSKSTDLARLTHPHVIDTRSIGRAPEGHLVVVTELQDASISVEELLREAAPKGLPQHVAAGIARQFLEGLAAAHDLGIVHGAVHPRSVLVSRDGTARLGDFAPGHALAAAMWQELASPLRDSLAGYLAPELLRGKPSSKASDVYAAAAVVYVMLSGVLPPGTLDISPGFERMIQRALDSHVARRYADAKEFLENLVEAMEDDLWPQATAAEIGAYIADARTRLPAHRSASDVALEEATEDLVSVLGGAQADAPAAPDAGQDDGGDVDAVLASLDLPTRVDSKPAGQMVERDPISELIALSGDGPVPDGARGLEAPPTRPDAAPEAPAQAPGQAQDQAQDQAAAEPASEAAALAAIAALEGEEGEDSEPAEPAADAGSGDQARAGSAPASRAASPPPADPGAGDGPGGGRAVSAPEAAAQPAPRAAPVIDEVFEQIDPGLDVALQKKSALGRVLWFLALLAGVAALLWVVYTQSGLREKAERAREQQRKANEAALAAFRASQPKSGRILVDSKPGEAAVWMLLGRTPLDSDQMSASMLHELRLEFDGYVPRDVRVGAEHWTGSGDDMRAEVRVTLREGRPDKPLPAYPPKPPESARQGLPDGKGPIHVESAPPGAQVWLLVGFTPGVEVTGYAGSDYEFKVVKEGFLPGYVTIDAEDWDAGGNAQQVSRTVELERRSR